MQLNVGSSRSKKQKSDVVLSLYRAWYTSLPRTKCEITDELCTKHVWGHVKWDHFRKRKHSKLKVSEGRCEFVLIDVNLHKFEYMYHSQGQITTALHQKQQQQD